MSHISLRPEIVTDAAMRESRATAADVKSKIKEALKRNAEAEAQNIQVSMIADGEVALAGKVHDWREREAVTSAAWSASGIRSVEDRLSFN